MSFKKTRMPLYLVASLLFGLKTYIIYRFMFNIDLDNFMQEFILFINPFIFSYLLFAVSIWFNKKSRQMKFIRYSILIGTIILYANLVFYRSFTDFITIPQLFQTSNAADLGSSILSLIKVYDLLLFADVIFVWYMSKKGENRMAVHYPRSGKVFALALSLVLLAGNFLLAEMERPQLFTRAFDREYLVKNIGVFNYHIYDIIVHSKVKTQRVLADGNELPAIQSYIEEEIRSNQESDLFGVAKDKNIIFISAESVQSFVINNEVNGEVITPFLNSLVNDESTYYFENFYHQTMQGKTSDSEFITENSLYPASRGAVFFTHGQNEYHAMPEMLEENGYQSFVFHANNRSFWNRDQIYDQLHFDEFYDIESYEVTDENTVGWGLKDKSFFEQSIPYLQELEKPFYSKLITLTNHFPFELDEEDRSIDLYDSNSNTLNHYFPTVRYTDEAIEGFFEQLKQAGLYEDSIIVIMGDHDGISATHNRAMSQYLGLDEMTPYDYLQLQRVPFFIHIPGHDKGKVMSEIAGQIDVKPTLLHLVGIETDEDVYFGNDLFHDDRKGYIAFRNGDYISEEHIYTANTCYDRMTGEILEADLNMETPCSPIEENVEMELNYSDEIIYGDLFRFIDFDKNE